MRRPADCFENALARYEPRNQRGFRQLLDCSWFACEEGCAPLWRWQRPRLARIGPSCYLEYVYVCSISFRRTFGGTACTASPTRSSSRKLSVYTPNPTPAAWALLTLTHALASFLYSSSSSATSPSLKSPASHVMNLSTGSTSPSESPPNSDEATLVGRRGVAELAVAAPGVGERAPNAAKMEEGCSRENGEQLMQRLV